MRRNTKKGILILMIISFTVMAMGCKKQMDKQEIPNIQEEMQEEIQYDNVSPEPFPSEDGSENAKDDLLECREESRLVPIDHVDNLTLENGACFSEFEECDGGVLFFENETHVDYVYAFDHFADEATWLHEINIDKEKIDMPTILNMSYDAASVGFNLLNYDQNKGNYIEIFSGDDLEQLRSNILNSEARFRMNSEKMFCGESVISIELDDCSRFYYLRAVNVDVEYAGVLCFEENGQYTILYEYNPPEGDYEQE